MCGLIGYVGRRDAREVIVNALERMEYRGYDSSGLALLNGLGGLTVRRCVGRVRNLERLTSGLNANLLSGTAGLGHTRWATHGRPSDRNAHPHVDATGKIAVVHNGIIENYASLRVELERSGVEMASDTDTEVAAQLVGQAYRGGPTAGDFKASVISQLSRFQGQFALVFANSDDPGTLIAARRSTPLMIGVGHGEMFVASDVSAFVEYTRDAIEIQQDQVVLISESGYTVADFSGCIVDVNNRKFRVDWELAAAEKCGHSSFMQKEIAEQPEAVLSTLVGHYRDRRVVLDKQGATTDELRDVNKVFIVACGSAYHSGLVAKYAIEKWVRLPVEVEVASEFRYRDPVLDPRTLVLAVSQSGETADTLEAVRHAKRKGARVLAVCNTIGSQIPRESDAALYTHAGPEIGVASTKAFLAQIAANYVVALALAQARGAMAVEEIEQVFEQLSMMPKLIRESLDRMAPVYELARKISSAPAVLFIGRHVGYPVALEGALKLKELAYMHAEGFAAGELKHGPIALIEEGLPIVVVMPSPKHSKLLHSKMISNIQEVRARGAFTIVLADDDDDFVGAHADALIRLPHTSPMLQPLISTIPMQAISVGVSLARGYDIDKPRNLAKSVTVE